MKVPEMNPWHLSQVLLAASPLKSQVISMMYTYDLNDYYRELVLNGQSGGMTNMGILENDMATYGRQIDEAHGDLIRNYLLWDELSQGYTNLDAHLQLYDLDQYTWTRAAIKHRQGDFAGALSLLGDCMIDGVVDDQCTVQKILTQADQAGQECPRFSPSQKLALEAIAADTRSSGYAAARAALTAEFDSSWPIDIRVSPSTRSAQLEEKVEASGASPIEFNPNPSSGSFWMTMKNSAMIEGARLEIFDPMGKLVLVKNIQSVITEIQLGEFENGIYVYNVLLEGVRVAEGKLTKIE